MTTQHLCPRCSSPNLTAHQTGNNQFTFGCNECNHRFATPKTVIFSRAKPEPAPPPQPVPAKPQKPLSLRIIAFIGETIYAIIFMAVLGGFLVLGFTYGTVLGTGSMEPTFSGNDFIWLNPLASTFQRGDLIIFPDPRYAGEDTLMKRIVGLPGESIQVSGGHVYINDKQLNEPWIPDFAAGTISDPKRTLGHREYYVLGDNRQFSYDSTEIGPVPQEDIIHKVFLHLDLSPLDVNFGEGLRKLNKSSTSPDAEQRMLKAQGVFRYLQ